jgi:ABC-type phosphate transport system substrate-binding protein
MKTSKLIVPLITGALFAAVANSQATDFDIAMTGSTAFRSIAVDAIKSLFDTNNAGVPQVATAGSVSDAANGVVYSGTMSNLLSGNTAWIHVHATFSGSAQGANDVYGHHTIGTYTVTGFSTDTSVKSTITPDLAFTDNWPAGMANPIKNSLFDDGGNSIIGVNCFAFIANTNLVTAGVTNIDRERVKLLIDDNGSSLEGGADLPARYLGATDPVVGTNVVSLLGRDIGSGTRITMHATVGYTGIKPVQWAVDNSGNIVRAQDIAGQLITYAAAGLSANACVKTNATLGDPLNGFALDGYDSGGTLVKVCNVTPNTFGYASYPDATATGNKYTTNLLSYEGILPSPANVESGAYPFWSYEHLLSVGNVNGDTTKQAIKAKLVATISSPTFQQSDANYWNNGSNPLAPRLGSMHVTRNVDGGPILPISGY